MTQARQPEAPLLKLAADLDFMGFGWVADVVRQAHAENTALQQGYDAARLEIESLKALLDLHPPTRHCMCADCAPSFESSDDGWMQDGGLLYRLTDGPRPQNRDEINVTMADGSRTPEARARRAGELLNCIHAAQAAPAAVAVPSDDVQKQIQSNTWDHFGDILPTLKAISRGEWHWGMNSRCKYIELRIDTRDGGCILYDRDRVRISPEQFAFQAGNAGKMDAWPAKNQITAAPQPPVAAHPCKGDPGECSYNGACMYACGAPPTPVAEQEPWYGHQFKEVQRGVWRCACGKQLKEQPCTNGTPNT